MSDRWFTQHRQDWIATMLRVYGFINREHIVRMFKLSMQQASKDIQDFLKANPDVMWYNASSKRYELVSPLNSEERHND